MTQIKIEVPMQLLDAATICAAKKDVRFYLNGVAFSHGHIVSTDGHRAFACLVGGLNEDLEFIIPTEAIKSFIKKVPAKTRIADCTVFYDPSTRHGEIHYGQEARELFIAIDGKYPDWRRVFPQKIPTGEYKGFVPQFNWQYLVDFQKIHKTLGGNGINVGFQPQAVNEVAGIFFTGKPFEDDGRFKEVKACLMPCRI